MTKEQEFALQNIVSHKLIDGVFHYEIKWVGCKETTFEPAGNLNDKCYNVVIDYFLEIDYNLFCFNEIFQKEILSHIESKVKGRRKILIDSALTVTCNYSALEFRKIFCPTELACEISCENFLQKIGLQKAVGRFLFNVEYPVKLRFRPLFRVVEKEVHLVGRITAEFRYILKAKIPQHHG